MAPVVREVAHRVRVRVWVCAAPNGFETTAATDQRGAPENGNIIAQRRSLAEDVRKHPLNCLGTVRGDTRGRLRHLEATTLHTRRCKQGDRDTHRSGRLGIGRPEADAGVLRVDTCHRPGHCLRGFVPEVCDSRRPIVFAL